MSSKEGLAPRLQVQAAVLDHFEVQWLETKDKSDEEVAEFLLSQCDRVTGSHGRRYWRITRRSRVDVWRRTPLNELHTARRSVRQAPAEPAQLAIDRVLERSVQAPAAVSQVSPLSMTPSPQTGSWQLVRHASGSVSLLSVPSSQASPAALFG